MQRFANYGPTLKAANSEAERSFTEVEQDAHRTDHALIGALMARSWGVSQEVCLAIRLHHDYAVFSDAKVPETVARLIAMGLLAERAIQTFAGLNSSTEWVKGGDGALGALMLGDADVLDWEERLVEGFPPARPECVTGSRTAWTAVTGHTCSDTRPGGSQRIVMYFTNQSVRWESP